MNIEPFCPPTSTSLYDRRRLAAAASMLPELWLKIPEWPSVGGGRRVLVIGGGIAGLCAAFGLRAAGFAPVVLERTARVGGRIYTQREGFGEQYVELGATRLPGCHPLPLAYVRHFGLPLVEYPGDELRQIYAVLDRCFASSLRGADYPGDLGLTPQEARLDAEGLHHHYTERALGRFPDPRDPDWPPPLVREALKGQSFYDCLDRLGASLAAREICRAYCGSVIEVYDALAWLAGQRIEGAMHRAYAIAGGNDRLAACFAEALAGRIVCNAHVQAVRSQEDGVQVDYVQEGRAQSVTGDYAVCAVPHRLLLEIGFEPPLSAEKREAAAAVPMCPVTRLNLQFSRRFWSLDRGVRGLLVACTTRPLERIWDLTAVQPGASGILVAYAQHKHAEALDRLRSDEVRLQRGLDEIDALFPGARGAFLRGRSFSWQQPWTQGAWPAFLPDQTRHIADFQHAEGRVFFAGDHATLHSAWVQGALESSHFAVAELLAAQREELRRP